MGACDDEDCHAIDDRLVGFLRERLDDADEGQVMPTTVIVVAGFLTADGEDRWFACTQGNGSTSGSVGLLEYAKAWLVAEMMADGER